MFQFVLVHGIDEMNQLTSTNIDNLLSEDRELQNRAFTYILRITDHPVDWAYEAWDDLVKDLRHKDNHKVSETCMML